MSSFEFEQNPIQFECDVGDGKGKREFWYTPINKTLYVEDDEIIKTYGDGPPVANITAEGHPSMRDGMIPINSQTQHPLGQLYWRATRAWREHFDLEWEGVPSEMSEQISGTISENGNEPVEREGQEDTPTEQEQPTSQPPRPPFDPPPIETFSGEPISPEHLHLPVDIETYAMLKYAPVIENQAIIIETYEMLMQTYLEPDSPVHELVTMLRERAQNLKETYCVRTEAG